MAMMNPPLLSEENATRLAEFYTAEHARFSGSRAPLWQSWDAAMRGQVRLSNGTTITVAQAAEAFELMMAPLGGQPQTIGEGSVWNGVDTLIGPVDAAMFSTLLWEHQPDLLIEIGTECGGSAIFFASLMRQYSTSAVVITYDVMPTWRRCSKEFVTRRTWKGYKSPLWQAYTREGSLVARVADVSAPAELALIASYVRAAKRVWVIDDGDHTTTPLLVHFHLLAKHVSRGGYYIVADTRLERTCLAGWRLGYRTPYCRDILVTTGGPARAVRYLQSDSEVYRELGFEVDRSAERWGLTQHPGGFLRRRCARGASGRERHTNCQSGYAGVAQPWPLIMTANLTADRSGRKARQRP
jgi:cephalosporin hydroxylase